ncbi:MAG TPA: hypothetical protein VGD75_15640, partial [Bradyrhizobium sp.]
MPRALVVDDEAVVDAGVRALQAAIFEVATVNVATFNRMPIDRFPSPDFPEMILEPEATFRLRKPF